MEKNSKNLKKETKKISNFKRRLIQLYSALLFNSYLKGYITGEIFKGMSKNVCTPGLNCYSCPGAVTSCPLGALQNAFASTNKTAPYYMLGIVMLFGIMFGRWICGWLCPFGLLQDLLHKIKTPKLKKGIVTRVLSFIKYAILVIFVVFIPILYALRDFPLPAFCKYICPAGTFGGAIGLLINPANADKFGMLGPLFTWKFALMISIIVGAIFVYRLFCRFICPLGAIYGLFNKYSLFGIKLDKSKCIDCGACIKVCKMDINHVGDHECIMCGECISACPTKAISWKGAKIILPDNEIDAASSDEEKQIIEKKRTNRVKALKITVASVMALVLAASLVYFNFFSDAPDSNANGGTETPPNGDVGDGDTEEEITVGYNVGQKCPAYSLEIVDGNGEKINIRDCEGKAVVVNFWGTWCGPCKEELPHFDELATEYSDEVVFLIIHSVSGKKNASAYINEHFPDSKMVFAYDLPLTKTKDMYFDLLGGSDYYPRTIVLDKDGIITYSYDGKLSYEALKAEIDSALEK